MSRKLWAVTLACALLLSGCWSRREINDLGAVIAMGIDRGEGSRVALSLSVAQPGAAAAGKGQGGQGPQRQSRVLLYREADSFIEALRRAELASPRRLALDHIQILLFGERFARAGIDSLLDPLLRSPQMRLSTRVVVVQDASPLEILSSAPIMRSTQAEALRELESTRAGLMVTLKDFFIARSSLHISPIATTIRFRPHHPSETGGPAREVELAGAAVFKGDRATLFLDQQEVRAAIWLMTDARDAMVTAPCPGDDSGTVAVRIARAERRIEPVWDGRQLSFRIELEAHARIIELQCHTPIATPADLLAIETVIRKELSSRVTDLIRRLQESEVDPIGFGERVRAKLPAVWRQAGNDRWFKTWAKVPVHVESFIGLVHLNMTNEPPSTKVPTSKD